MPNQRNETQGPNHRDEEIARAAARKEKIEAGLRAGSTNTSADGMTFYGTPEQMGHVGADLSQVGAMTGQNIAQTGAQNQEYLNSLEARRHGTDAVAANMMNGRNRNLANVGRQFAGKGVAGGVAAAGMNEAQNTADSSINSQLQTNSKSNDKELFDYVKRNQKMTGEALAMGQDQGLAAGMDTSQAQGVFGTVICSELHRQGLMDDETYEIDKELGKILEVKYPTLMAGYRFIATPIVYKMISSKKVTNFIAFFALPWAKQLSGESSIRGKIVLVVGVPLCFLVGMFVPIKQEA